jgi:hypothetical protein
MILLLLLAMGLFLYDLAKFRDPMSHESRPSPPFHRAEREVDGHDADRLYRSLSDVRRNPNLTAYPAPHAAALASLGAPTPLRRSSKEGSCDSRFSLPPVL